MLTLWRHILPPPPTSASYPPYASLSFFSPLFFFSLFFTLTYVLMDNFLSLFYVLSSYQMLLKIIFCLVLCREDMRKRRSWDYSGSWQRWQHTEINYINHQLHLFLIIDFLHHIYLDSNVYSSIWFVLVNFINWYLMLKYCVVWGEFIDFAVSNQFLIKINL